MKISNTSTAPLFIFKLGIEEDFSISKAEQWMEKNYHHCFYYTAAYLLLIFSIQHFMKNRKPFKLQKTLAIWNATLAFFSFWATTRFTHELIFVLGRFGFHYSVCNPSYLTELPVTSFWSYVGAASKALELFDTLFIVLRKQKLIFLHWFHHASMLIFTWVGIRDLIAFGRWCGTVNCAIHVVMYSYFAFRSLGYKIPKQVSITITLAQILQMILGCYVCSYSFVNWALGINCAVTGRVAIISVILLAVYLILFLNFFFQSYLKPKLIGRNIVKRD